MTATIAVEAESALLHVERAGVQLRAAKVLVEVISTGRRIGLDCLSWRLDGGKLHGCNNVGPAGTVSARWESWVAALGAVEGNDEHRDGVVRLFAKRIYPVDGLPSIVVTLTAEYAEES